ncbi:MAG TPA: tannase/feruloyl esterase family alpha/beta hydrolase, partial [Pseudomonadales bacterium]|nr:tannase/feruloyl esterase family alpha/beta hydrolase [Pseudomonadales bacterium]
MRDQDETRRGARGGMGALLLALTALLAPLGAAAATGVDTEPSAAAPCADLLELPDVTVLRAGDRTTAAGTAYCHARGIGPRAIAWHVALPAAWNGRLVYLGDGGQDGDLDDAPFLIDAGYAFVNSNMGHDDGVEGQAFGLDDPDSEFDFAWRAQHHALTAAKRIVAAHYGRPQHHAYHFGCSTGGRQGLLAAQILPDDYDGIVAGAPGHLWYERMAHRVAVLQTLYRDRMAANLAYDTDGDGVPEDLGKLAMLVGRVLNQCDAADGIRDGLVEPAFCDFEPRTALADLRCPDGTDGPACFTPAQLDAVVQLYEGSRD